VAFAIRNGFGTQKQSDKTIQNPIKIQFSIVPHMFSHLFPQRNATFPLNETWMKIVAETVPSKDSRQLGIVRKPRIWAGNDFRDSTVGFHIFFHVDFI